VRREVAPLPLPLLASDLSARVEYVSADRERVAAAMQNSLAVVASLRDQMREGGPGAVVEALQSMPEEDLRQVLLAVVVTMERAEEQG
jgi:ribosomal 50S subunit-associated protein YjgA (DUF615 family)